VDVFCDSRMSGGSRGLRLWLPSDRINGCLPTKNYVGRLFQAALNGPGISLTLGVSQYLEGQPGSHPVQAKLSLRTMR